MQRLAAALEQAFVGRVLDQRVLEAIGRLRPAPSTIRRSASASRSSADWRAASSISADSAQQRIGELASEDRADLRDFARFAQPVEPGRERLLKRRRDRLHAARLAALEQKPRDLLDEQRHPAGALAHALDHLLAQRMASGELADHLRDVGAIEGAERDDAVMGAQAPGRAEFRPRGRDDEERRLRAALGKSVHQIERGRVGPVQVLEREHDRLRPRPGENPAVERRQLPAAQFLRRELRRALLRQRDFHQRREQRRIFGGVETDQPKRILEVGEALAPAARSAPNRWRPHSAIGCKGVFCNSCDDDHSTKVCGVSPSFKRNSSTRRDLPMPGSPTTSASWPSPLTARSQRRRKRSSSSSRPTSGVSAPGAEASPAAARAHDPIKRRPASARP